MPTVRTGGETVGHKFRFHFIGHFYRPVGTASWTERKNRAQGERIGASTLRD
jgi:hypothetical protein